MRAQHRRRPPRTHSATRACAGGCVVQHRAVRRVRKLRDRDRFDGRRRFAASDARADAENVAPKRQS
ncbi:hypothetical protein WL27_21655 [Burkholderia multivorans]|nr:hypothetical protein WL27_21655 [Burkholderia multivorans]